MASGSPRVQAAAGANTTLEMAALAQVTLGERSLGGAGEGLDAKICKRNIKQIQSNKTEALVQSGTITNETKMGVVLWVTMNTKDKIVVAWMARLPPAHGRRATKPTILTMLFHVQETGKIVMGTTKVPVGIKTLPPAPRVNHLYH